MGLVSTSSLVMLVNTTTISIKIDCSNYHHLYRHCNVQVLLDIIINSISVNDYLVYYFGAQFIIQQQQQCEQEQRLYHHITIPVLEFSQVGLVYIGSHLLTVGNL